MFSYGNTDMLEQILEDIVTYTTEEYEDNVWILGVKGSIGAGKTLFCRNLI
jgi:tRNA A37 threonylcarbamoyladenosine biosynthesis protein TsaE